MSQRCAFLQNFNRISHLDDVCDASTAILQFANSANHSTTLFHAFPTHPGSLAWAHFSYSSVRATPNCNRTPKWETTCISRPKFGRPLSTATRMSFFMVETPQRPHPHFRSRLTLESAQRACRFVFLRMMRSRTKLPDDRSPKVLTVIKNLHLCATVRPSAIHGLLALIDRPTPELLELPRVGV